jgi:hypothetical protein
MLKPVPLTANCLIKTDHSGEYALTWRLDGLDVHSRGGTIANIGEPSSLWPVIIGMVKVSRAQERKDLLLSSSVLGVLLLVAVSGCAYRKPKSGRNGDGGRLGARVN